MPFVVPRLAFPLPFACLLSSVLHKMCLYNWRMAEIILLRHGRSKGNANKGIIQGSGPEPENTLDATGREQSHAAALRLRAAGIVPALFFASPLPRARQTCEIVRDDMGFGHMTIHLEDNLREMCKGLKGLPGGMEGRKREDVETDQYWADFKRYGRKYRHGSPESKGE